MTRGLLLWIILVGRSMFSSVMVQNHAVQSSEPNSGDASDGGIGACAVAKADESTLSPSNCEHTSEVASQDGVFQHENLRLKSALTVASESIVNEGSEENPLAASNLHFDGSAGLTPTAAAWTPGGSFKTSFEQEKSLGTEVVKKGQGGVEFAH